MIPASFVSSAKGKVCVVIATVPLEMSSHDSQGLELSIPRSLGVKYYLIAMHPKNGSEPPCSILRGPHCGMDHLAAILIVPKSIFHFPSIANG